MDDVDFFPLSKFWFSLENFSEYFLEADSSSDASEGAFAGTVDFPLEQLKSYEENFKKHC